MLYPTHFAINFYVSYYFLVAETSLTATVRVSVISNLCCIQARDMPGAGSWGRWGKVSQMTFCLWLTGMEAKERMIKGDIIFLSLF